MVDKIRQLCKEQGKNLFSLEKECGLGNGTINKWDRSSPSVAKVAVVADALGVPVTDLIEAKTTKKFSIERLKEIMGEMSCEEFAKKIDGDAKAISQYLNGERTPQAVTVAYMEGCLGITPDWLYGLDVPKFKKPIPVSEDGFSEAEQSMLQLFRLVPVKDQGMVTQMIEAALRSRGLF